MNQLTSLQREVLLACSEDDVGLWEIIRFVEWALPAASATEIKEKVFETVLALLKAGLIDAGLPVPECPTFVFKSWNLQPEEAIERIHREWDQLGHKPTLGDIVWFVSTMAGDRILAEGQERNVLKEPDHPE